MLTRKQIIEEIFSYISEETGKKITYNSSGNGYFIIEVGDYFNTHFKLDGAKNWLFGIWIYDNEEDNHEDKKHTFTISMFGQHDWFIDKFKPSCSPFSFEVEVDKDLEHLYETEIYNGKEFKEFPYEIKKFSRVAQMVTTSNIASMIKYYWDEYDGKPFSWLTSTSFYHRIQKPMNDFINNELLYVWLNMKKLIHKSLFFRYVKSIDVIDNDKGNSGWKTYPRYNYIVTLRKENTDYENHRMWNLTTPLYMFDNVGHEVDIEEGSHFIYFESPVKNDYIDFRNKTIDDYCNESFWKRLKHIFGYPVYWFKFKFESVYK